MTFRAGSCPAGRQATPPAGADYAEVLRLGALFLRHHIFCVFSAYRAVRYVAYGTALGVRPHTIITDDLAELRDELEQAGLGAVPGIQVTWQGPGG